MLSLFLYGGVTMPANREENGTWTVQCYYSDWSGTRKKKKKRGFATKRDALEWEREFLARQQGDTSMSLSAFIDVYMEDMAHRLKASTVANKQWLFDQKIKPYLGDRQLDAITAADVRKWQNQVMSEGHSPTYLKSIHSQLSSVFNYAVKYYGLKENPCQRAGTMGKAQADEMQFWTVEEYKKFRDAARAKIRPFTAFELLYYTGMRIGEFMALTRGDIDTSAGTVTINKTYWKSQGKETITPPKTPKSNRTITIPPFLCQELDAYFAAIYGLEAKDRIFPFTKQLLAQEMKLFCQESGVKRIRLHDLRHSHASLLIELGFSPLLIAERLGHESVETTMNTYAHLYPHKQGEVAQKLEEIGK